MALAPNRTDWRWLLACQAAEFTDSQAIYQLRDADEVTRKTYLFKRASDNGLDTSRWPEFEAAHELWSNRLDDKLYIEGMLLGKASVDQAAYDVGAGCQDVQTFHDVFFDVTSRLDRPGWLVARLFGGQVYCPLSSRDRVGIMHRLSWLAGHEFFRSFYTGLWDDSIKGILGERLRDMLGKQSMLASMCLGGRGELDIELVRVFVDDVKRAATDSVGASGDKELQGAVMGFLSNMSVEVANPLAPANLNLAAREPRAHEIIAQAIKVPHAEVHV